MPLCYLHTAPTGPELKEGFETRLGQAIAKTLDKKFEVMNFVALPGSLTMRMGSTAPACLIIIRAVDRFDAQRNPTYTPAIKQALQDEFGLPAERCGILYVDLDRSFIG